MNFKLKFFMTIFILLSLFQVTNVPLTNNTTSMTNSQDSVTGVIKVGVLVPLTGSLSTYSLGFLDGIKSAALAINKSSNYGFSIELVIADTGTNPTTTLSAYNTLKTDGVQLIIGPASSTDSLAIVQSASVDHIPIISYSSTSPMLSNKSYDYFYRTISSDILQMDALASVLNHFNQKKVVIAYQNDSYGASLENETRTSFVNLGISVAGELNYSLGTTDFSDMVTSISSISNVDGVVFIGFATEGGYFITQLRQSGNNLPVYSSSGGIPQTNINSNNIIGVDIVGGHVGQAMYDQFVSDLKTCNLDGVCSGGNTPRVFSDFSYDAMMVGALAVNMSATYDGATIKSNLPLAGTNYIGATGNKSFSALGDQIYGSTEIWQIQNQQVVNIGSYDNQTGLILKNLFHWQYKPHAQITISSNSDFTPNDFTGSGTQLKPYILQGYSFTASVNELISIQSTTAYFEISNCLFNGLNGAYAGIQLFTVQNGLISHNDVFNNSEDGIRIDYNSVGIKVTNNTVHDNGWNGIFVKSSTQINITENNVQNDNYIGIRLEYSNNSAIIENNVQNSKQSGIFTYNSHNNLIKKNNAFNNIFDGILLELSNNDDILENTVYSNSGWGGISLTNSSYENVIQNSIYKNLGNGIVLQNASYSDIGLNEIFNNIYAGIRLTDESLNNEIFSNVLYKPGERNLWIESGSSQNTIKYNDFLESSNVNTKPIDDGTSNTYSNNYWPDWTGSGSKIIDGSANSKDNSPASNPNHLTAPDLSLPISINNNQINLSWNETIDTFNHGFTYTLYYSIDGGITWNLIINKLTTTVFNWDIKNINLQNGLKLKIEAIDFIGFTSFKTFDLVKAQPVTTSSTTTTSPQSTSTGNTIHTSSIGFMYPILGIIIAGIVLKTTRKKRKI